MVRHTAHNTTPTQHDTTQSMIQMSWKRPLYLAQSTAFDDALLEPPVYDKDAARGAGAAAEEEVPQTLNLANCLKQFATREQLSETDTWYCPSCKDHVQAFKKMDLWKLPDTLIFHLKRFSYEVGQWATHREKLGFCAPRLSLQHLTFIGGVLR